jgi:pimeloyl-ACP methyl ester carboxylesterase
MQNANARAEILVLGPGGALTTVGARAEAESDWSKGRRSCYHNCVPDGLFVDDLPSDAGDAAPLVLLVHGTMDRQATFARVRSRLVDSCHVVSYDRRGYAGSRDVEPPAAGIEDHLADLEEVVAGRRCTLAGHSYGGTLALTFAARHPDLAASLLVYEPPLPWMEAWPTHGRREQPFAGVAPEQAARSFLQRMIGEQRYERLPLRTRQEIEKDGPALVAEMTAIRNSPSPFDPAAIAAPTLVARGGDSVGHHVWGPDLLVAQMPAASLRIVPGASHGAHQSHPREFAALVLEAVALATSPSASAPT